MTDTPSSQGYVTMAYGPRKFFEMAVNLALSVKLNDPARPIALLYKDAAEIPGGAPQHFDRCMPFENLERYPGVTIKLGVYEPSPYAETLYIDADCLIVKRDMDRHWAKYGAQDFAISGEVVTSGAAYGCDVSEMMAAAGADYFCDMNCGIVFFRKSDGARKVFGDARALLAEGHKELIELRPRRGDGLSDQPYFAAAMARNNIKPVFYAPEEGTIMATTWQAKDVMFDVEKAIGRVKKPAGFRLFNRFWAKGWVQHESSVAHFIEMKPRALYQRQSDWLRGHFGVEPYAFE
jgi:hypothetical protein